MFYEQTTQPIEVWDITKAMELARCVNERHGATPFAFFFTTRERADDELDSRQSARSGTYYLGGKVETLADVESRNDPAEEILRSNMKCNGWEKIITNCNSYKVTQPLREGDVVLQWVK